MTAPGPGHTARLQGSWFLAWSQACTGHSVGAFPATHRSPHPAPPSPTCKREHTAPASLFGSSQPSSSSKTEIPKPCLPLETKWNFTGSSLERKRKPSPAGKEEPKTVLLKRKKKKFLGFEPLLSVADNQETGVGCFKNKLIFHVKPKPDRSINL